MLLFLSYANQIVSDIGIKGAARNFRTKSRQISILWYYKFREKKTQTVYKNFLSFMYFTFISYKVLTVTVNEKILAHKIVSQEKVNA